VKVRVIVEVKPYDSEGAPWVRLFTSPDIEALGLEADRVISTAKKAIDKVAEEIKDAPRPSA